MALALTPALHTTRGQRMPHRAVLDEIGVAVLHSLGANRPVHGWDHLSFATTMRIAPPADAPSIRITIKLTETGTYTVERGHVDRTRSVPLYLADQQLIGVAWSELRDTVIAMVVAGAAHPIDSVTSP